MKKDTIINKNIVQLEEVTLEDVEIITDSNTPGIGGLGNICGAGCFAGSACGLGCL